MKAFINKHKYLLLTVLGGILTGLTLVLPEIGFLQWTTTVPAFYALIKLAENEEIKLRRIYGFGFAYFMGYYVVTFHWFWYMYPLEFTGMGKAAALAVVLAGNVGLALLQTVGSALVFPIAAYLLRYGKNILNSFVKVILVASLFSVCEYLQTFFWFGVPWGRPALGQIEATVLVRSASLFGTYFVTFILAAVNFALAMSLVNKEKKKLFCFFALGLFSLNLALGLIVTATYKESGEKVRVSALQGNISSTEKWSSGSRDRVMKVYERLTAAAADEGAEIVLMPETALPYYVLDDDEMSDYISYLATEYDVTVLVSAFTESPESGNDLNSVIEIRPDGSIGEVIYSKQRPVPFGEFVPMRELIMFLIPPLANVSMLDSDLEPGKESLVMDTDAGRVGAAVCFDSIYETITRDSVQNGAELIAIATNDSWFSDSRALDMHNAQARLRAIESGRYVLRSANTGISSVIDPLGNVIGSLGAKEEGIVTADVYMRNEMTLYSIVGNLFVYITTAGLLISLMYVAIKTKSCVKYVNKL